MKFNSVMTMVAVAMVAGGVMAGDSARAQQLQGAKLFNLTYTPGSMEFKRYNIDLQDGNIEQFGLVGTRKIALTFDDGPGAGTARVLDLLKANNIKATFFVVGQMIKGHDSLMKRIVNEGHVLASHSYTHAQLNEGVYSEKPDMLYKELRANHELMKPYLKDGARLYFRAPYGSWTPGHGRYLNQDPILRQYVGPIYWDIGKGIERNKTTHALTNAGDWACWRKKNGLPMDQCLQGYLNKIRSLQGGVILMHDIHVNTATMFELMLPILIKEGYSFVTIDELPALDKYRNDNIIWGDSQNTI